MANSAQAQQQAAAAASFYDKPAHKGSDAARPAQTFLMTALTSSEAEVQPLAPEYVKDSPGSKADADAFTAEAMTFHLQPQPSQQSKQMHQSGPEQEEEDELSVIKNILEERRRLLGQQFSKAKTTG